MIRLEDVHKRYGHQKVLNGVSFEVKTGSVTTIMGRSGAGKSVLMKHMIGLERPDSGRILIDERNIVGMNTPQLNKIRRRFGVLFQDGALFDSFSVKDNVAFPLREHLKVSERQVSDTVHDKLALVGMTGHEDKFPGALSGGMRKRVGLARALALEPDIVFFDEPTSGLDPITKGVIYRLIMDTHARRSTTYVLVSHDIKGILELSDEVMLLFDGKIIVQGTPEEIRNSSDLAVRQFLTGSPEGPMAID